MLSVNLGQLGREGFASVESVLAADDELWKDTGLVWVDGVEVQLRAVNAGTGEIVARGSVDGVLRHECRRCLEEVQTSFRRDLTLVFVSDGSDEDEESGAYPFDESESYLDMSTAVREEILLEVNPYVECTPDCAGLCPQCGTNLNEAECDCTVDEVDPRWGALRDLKSE